MIARRIEELVKFEFNVKHGAGRKISYADCLSRIKTNREKQTSFAFVFSIAVEEKNIAGVLFGNYRK